MQTYKFDCHKFNAPMYGCNKPGDNSGEYVRLDDVLEWLRTQQNDIPVTGEKMAADLSYVISHDSKISKTVFNVQYLAWLSSRGERQMIKDGAVFAGLVQLVPKEYMQYLYPDGENRHYCVITKVNG